MPVCHCPGLCRFHEADFEQAWCSKDYHQPPSSSILDLSDTHINAGLISILLHLKQNFSASEAGPSINEANKEEEKR